MKVLFNVNSKISGLTAQNAQNSVQKTTLAQEQNYLAPINYYELVCNDIVVGCIGVVHPSVQSKIDKDNYMVVSELNVSVLNDMDSLNYRVEQISKFPVTTLDFNFVLGADDVYGTIEKVAQSVKTDLAYKCELVDIFKNVDDNTKSYTIRYMVTSMDHTLSSAEIETFHKEVILTFENNKIYLKG